MSCPLSLGEKDARVKYGLNTVEEPEGELIEDDV
jgi:hypothetical protein